MERNRLKVSASAARVPEMSGARVRVGWLLWGFGLACGGAPRPAPEAPAQPAAERSGEASANAAGGESRAPAGTAAASAGPDAPTPDGAGSAAEPLPTRCTEVGDLCLPPRSFVKKLCQDAYTGATLRLFDKSSPFSRGYVRSREVRAVNTLGGPSSDQSLRFEEEVLILTECARAEAQLSESIVAAVRAGMRLPLPERMP
jgi:hypothetical protein